MASKSEIMQQIANLTQILSSPSSELGDWKIIKYAEYLGAGLEPPYDMKSLHIEREAIRKQIEELQKELNNLNGCKY